MDSITAHTCVERRFNVRAYQGMERRTTMAGGKPAERERELVLQATGRNQAAFAQLYDRYVDKIFKYIYYRVGDSSQAEDLTSQVFFKAWEAIGRYQYTERPFAAWLYRIAHNLLVDYFRTKHDVVSLDEMTSLEQPGCDLEEIFEHHLNAEMLRSALHYLTPDQQQVIILRFLQGYATTEVAQIMGKQPGAVRTLQHRALAGLLKVLRNNSKMA